jgi:hypothetical protein
MLVQVWFSHTAPGYYGENERHVMFCVKPGEHEFIASFMI